MNRNTTIILLFIGILLLSGCQRKSHPTTTAVVPINRNQITKVAVIKPKKSVVRQISSLHYSNDYHPLKGILVYTSTIGTPEHPTIDGGMINSADGIPINHDNPDVATPDSTNLEVKNSDASTHAYQDTTKMKQKPFQDSWATSVTVKELLTKASEQGKLGFVLKKAEQMNLPASVAVVPMVESQYQINAISSKGAAGAWQLMPSVAEDYGIQNQMRFQFTTSTDIALQLLSSLHQQFGNWDLTFAAYNAGSQRVEEALAENPNANSIDDLNLPIETKNYVKKLMDLNETLMKMGENHA